MKKILLLDIETAPAIAHVWSLFKVNVYLDQLVQPGYTLCWAAKWLGEKTVYTSSRLDGIEVMLERIHDLIEKADVVCHYNGTKFDMPTLYREFVVAGLRPPSPVAEIDLLKTVKRKFRFQSNKLDFVAQSLGLGSKVKHKGHSLWSECMDGDPKAFKQMLKYNLGDVLLLEKLYNKLLPWIPTHPVMDTGHVCPKCSSSNLQKRGHHVTKTLSYQRYQCNDCGSWSRDKGADKSVENPTIIPCS